MLSHKLFVLSLFSTLVIGSLASAQSVISRNCDLGDGNSLQIYYGGPVLEYPRDLLTYKGKKYPASTFNQNGAEVQYTATELGIYPEQPPAGSNESFTQMRIELSSISGEKIFGDSDQLTIPDAICTNQNGFEALDR